VDQGTTGWNRGKENGSVRQVVSSNLECCGTRQGSNSPLLCSQSIWEKAGMGQTP
jgi:hypothetical protein